MVVATINTIIEIDVYSTTEIAKPLLSSFRLFISKHPLTLKSPILLKSIPFEESFVNESHMIKIRKRIQNFKISIT